MNSLAATLIFTAIALSASAWAGLLVMLQEHPEASPSPDGSHALTAASAWQDRLTRNGRVALLVLAGVAASEVVGWWHQPPAAGLGRAALAAVLLYMIAEGLPRSASVLMPGIPAALAPLARLTLGPFVPLAGITGLVGSMVERVFPATEHSADRFGKEHRDMLHGVFTLSETTVSEIMTPRLDIMAIESSADWKTVVDSLSRGDHARVIVYTDDLDHIDGVLYTKDLTAAIAGVTDAPDDWHDWVRPAQFVPESKVLTAQLSDFQRGRSGLAVVVDEFGGTSGLITLEDVLEEIVGEIHGEYDVDVEPAVESEGEDRFWVEGGLPLDDLSELLGVVFEREDVTTVGGLVYSELGRVPKPGEAFRIEGFRVVVEQVEKRRVRRVYFERTITETLENSGEEPDK